MKNGPYNLVKAPEGYPGKTYRENYVYEHHAVWYLATGEIVPSGYLIHHVNGDKRDNRIENLEVVERGDHTRKHAIPAERVEVTCVVCGRVIQRRVKVYEFNAKRNSQNCCSKQCAGMVGK